MLPKNGSMTWDMIHQWQVFFMVWKWQTTGTERRSMVFEIDYDPTAICMFLFKRLTSMSCKLLIFTIRSINILLKIVLVPTIMV